VEHRDSLCRILVQEANAFDIQKIHLIQIQRYSRSAATEFGLHLINVVNSKFATQANPCFAPPRNPIDSQRQWILGSDTD
jgi:hypothetical protein